MFMNKPQKCDAYHLAMPISNENNFRNIKIEGLPFHIVIFAFE